MRTIKIEKRYRGIQELYESENYYKKFDNNIY